MPTTDTYSPFLPNHINPRKRQINVVIADVSTTGQIYFVMPYKALITKVTSVLNGTIATADAVLTVKDGDGNSMGTITIVDGSSAAGDVDTLSPTSNNVVATAEVIEIETAGASTNTVSVFLTVEYTQLED